MLYKGKEYEVKVGARGGSYIVVDGKKKYIKSEKSEKKVANQPRLKHYICYYKIRENGETVDDFKEWCDAYNRTEAETEFRNRYPNENKYYISFIQECKQ